MAKEIGVYLSLGPWLRLPPGGVRLLRRTAVRQPRRRVQGAKLLGPGVQLREKYPGVADNGLGKIHLELRDLIPVDVHHDVLCLAGKPGFIKNRNSRVQSGTDGQQEIAALQNPVGIAGSGAARLAKIQGIVV